MLEWATKNYMINFSRMGVVDVMGSINSELSSSNKIVFNCFLKSSDVPAKITLTPKILTVSSDDGLFYAEYAIENEFKKVKSSFFGKPDKIVAKLKSIKIFRIIYKQMNQDTIKSIKFKESGKLQSLKFNQINLKTKSEYDFTVLSKFSEENLMLDYFADIDILNDFMSENFIFDVNHPYESISQAPFIQEFKEVALKIYPSTKHMQVSAPIYQNKTADGLEYSKYHQIFQIDGEEKHQTI